VYCPKCYRLNPDENEFCSKCGYKLKKVVGESPKSENRTKYCSYCGSEILQSAVVCPECGSSARGSAAGLDKPSIALNVLSFFIPLLGFILFCVFHNNYPRKAKAVGLSALLGVAVSVVLFVAIFVIYPTISYNMYLDRAMEAAAAFK